jgi:hypothetical protein
MTEYDKAKIERHVELANRAKELIDFYRGLVMDAVEADCEPKQWKQLRSRILKVLGDRGLEGKMIEMIDEYFEHKPR